MSLSPRDAALAQPDAAKWCSYCRKDTHNDAECWSTRPRDWRPSEGPIVLPERQSIPRGTYNPNETREELAERMKKIDAFVAELESEPFSDASTESALRVVEALLPAASEVAKDAAHCEWCAPEFGCWTGPDACHKSPIWRPAASGEMNAATAAPVVRAEDSLSGESSVGVVAAAPPHMKGELCNVPGAKDSAFGITAESGPRSNACAASGVNNGRPVSPAPSPAIAESGETDEIAVLIADCDQSTPHANFEKALQLAGRLQRRANALQAQVEKFAPLLNDYSQKIDDQRRCAETAERSQEAAFNRGLRAGNEQSVAQQTAIHAAERRALAAERENAKKTAAILDLQQTVLSLREVLRSLPPDSAVREAVEWPQQPTDDMLRAMHAAMFEDVRFGKMRNGLKAAYHAARREHERSIRALSAAPVAEGEAE